MTSEEHQIVSVSDSPYEIDSEPGEAEEILEAPHAIQPYMFQPIASDVDDEKSDSDYAEPEHGVSRDIVAKQY